MILNGKYSTEKRYPEGYTLRVVSLDEHHDAVITGRCVVKSLFPDPEIGEYFFVTPEKEIIEWDHIIRIPAENE